MIFKQFAENGKIKASKHWSEGANWNFIERKLFSKTNCLEVEDSRHWLQYSVQSQLETGANVDRKRARAPKLTTAVEDKHLIIESKRLKDKFFWVDRWT